MIEEEYGIRDKEMELWYEMEKVEGGKGDA
jgi:hypothetical protein